MKDAIRLHISGIKCDACDYQDRGVPVEDYDKWLNKPCPLCGANLLTQEDFDSVQDLLELNKLMNKMLPKVSGNEPLIRADLKFDGTGFVAVENITSALEDSEPEES